MSCFDKITVGCVVVCAFAVFIFALLWQEVISGQEMSPTYWVLLVSFIFVPPCWAIEMMRSRTPQDDGEIVSVMG
tara:strand:- start:49 stop:273 length:225 start_codon:yes stop_codon:yes gene_type:complete